MMILYVLFAITTISLCIVASVFDLCTGLIYNKMLLIYTVLAIIFDCIYYGFWAREYFSDFIINFLVMVCLCLVLFFTHSIAGGDCKFLMVLSLLYPAVACVKYNGSAITLFFVIAFAVLYGYIYLLVISLANLITDKTHVPKGYALQTIKIFVLNYFKAMIYISLLTIIFCVLTMMGIEVPNVLMSAVYFAAAWFVGRSEKLKKWKLIVPVLIIVIVFSLGFKVIPVSVHPRRYILVALLMMCQMSIRTNLYEEISLISLKKGMILSMASSMLFQNSRVRGLPGVSTEDLRSRLTQKEIDSILRWGEGASVESVTIVKKIPFAIFISLGVFSYYILWRLF